MSTNKKAGAYLAMDGGRCILSALYTLEELCSRLEFDQGSDEELLPCKLFDLLTGAGDGALGALMLGRMHMPYSQAIKAYTKLMPLLSGDPAKNDQDREKNTKAFEVAFSEILKDAGFELDAPMLDSKGPKIALYTSNIDNLSVPHVIRSYRIRGSPAPPCTILQAACASIASPDRFLPVTLGEDHRRAILIDGSPGYANPAREVLQEAQIAFGEDADVAALLSIGAGKGTISTTNDGAVISEALKRGIINCERVHEELQNRLEETGIYFRFNVEKDLDRKPESVLANTSAYLKEKMVSNRVDEAIKAVENRPAGVKLKDINSVTVMEVSLKPRPSLVENFIGREDILECMRRTHITERSSALKTPAITVLSGLGGSGKTQTALKFALEFEETLPNVPVYFLNASSEEKLKSDFETLIRSFGPAHHSKTCQDALVWLATKLTEWFLILDNADDPSIDLFRYIPKCAHGNVVITTRNSTFSGLAPNSSHNIEALSEADSITLILNTSLYTDTAGNVAFARAIAAELGYLPLALAHAAGYIFIHRCLPTYLEMYQQNKSRLLAQSRPELPHDYRSTVAMTIEMSLIRLPHDVRDLLRLLARFDAASIAHIIIETAAQRGFNSVLWTAETSFDPLTVGQAEVLRKIFCPKGEWQELDFNELIVQCLQYSLIQLTTQVDSKFYSMHPLVQSYLIASSKNVQGHPFGQVIVRLLGSAYTLERGHENIAFNRLLAPHLKLLNVDNIVEGGDACGFGSALFETGDTAVSLVHWKRCVELWKARLGEEHQHTQLAMSQLALAYKELGNIQAGLELEEQVRDIRTRIFGPEAPETLFIMGNLAVTYKVLGRVQDAIDLEKQVLDGEIKALGPEHTRTVGTMANLAVSYIDAGRYQESLELEEKVLEIRLRTVGPEHYDTLSVMANLAISYKVTGRNQEALDLEEKILPLRIKMLGPEHPDTMQAMSNLAVSYSEMKRNQEAVDLQEQVLKLRRKLLGSEHPNTLRTMGNLGVFYRRLGRDEDALVLDEEVLKWRTKVLGPEHSETITAMGNLAMGLYGAGRSVEALALEEKALALRIKVQGKGHPDTMKTMQSLYSTYTELGMREKLRDLLQIVVSAFEEGLGAEHPRTVALQQELDELTEKLEEGSAEPSEGQAEEAATQ